MMTRRLPLLLFPILAGCLFGPGWHWEKPGAAEEEYAADLKRCKLATYSGTDGMVNQQQVRRMQMCMEARGWRKTGD